MEHVISSYGERLAALVAERGPLCVGVDPHPSLLASWGLAADAQGLERCARGMIEALGGIIPVFKPQSAFFEAYGSLDAQLHRHWDPLLIECDCGLSAKKYSGRRDSKTRICSVFVTRQG